MRRSEYLEILAGIGTLSVGISELKGENATLKSENKELRKRLATMKQPVIRRGVKQCAQ
jgi:regulator of replication initiation timing